MAGENILNTNSFDVLGQKKIPLPHTMLHGRVE
jgi:hypothetical protein